MIGLDFADPERGLAASLRPAGPAVVFDHDDVLAASTDAGAQLPDDPAAETNLELDGVSLNLDLSPLANPLSLEGERSGSEELVICKVLGELRRDRESREIACLGIRSAAAREADPADASLTRSIAIAFSDGGILGLRAARPPEAGDHGEEETVAALADADGEVMRIREPLLSTQYDAEGRHVRATLELWPEEEAGPRPARRVAGTIVCGTSIPMSGSRLDIAFFRWSMDGLPGLGRYEVLSAPPAP
jgi:hypothetical protein